MSGRRIYVHEGSFVQLASQGEFLAHRVFRSIAAIRALKVLNHHTDQATELGLLTETTAAVLREEFGTPWQEEMTALLRNVGHRPRDPRARVAFHALLAGDEEVVATCEDSGYLTFATSAASACVMYGDQVPLKALRRATAAGEGPADLTMVWGRSLALVDSAFGTGADLGPAYGAVIANRSLTTGIVSQIRSDEFRRLVDEVTAFADCATELGHDEHAVVDGFARALAVVLLHASAVEPDTEQAS